MQTLIIPGYSKRNKEWVDKIAENLDVDGVIRPFYWMHWTDEDSRFDLNDKVELIARHIKDDDVNIVAKSVGVVVASKLFAVIPHRIGKVVFCGIPVNDLKPEEIEFIKMVCTNNNHKIIVIQNSSDPHGSYEQVKSFGNVIKKENNTHDYFYFEEINKILS